MIPRYTTPGMGRIWTEQRRYRGVARRSRLAAAERWRRPASFRVGRRARLRDATARFDIARIEEIEATTQHDVIAFTTAVAEHVGPAAR